MLFVKGLNKPFRTHFELAFPELLYNSSVRFGQIETNEKTDFLVLWLR